MDIEDIPLIIVCFLFNNMNCVVKPGLGHDTLVKGNVNSNFKKINYESYI